MKSFFTMSLLLLVPLFCAAQSSSLIKVTLSSTTWKPGEPITISWSSKQRSDRINLSIRSDANPSNEITIKTDQGRSGSLSYTPSEALCGKVSIRAKSQKTIAAGTASATIGSVVKISDVKIASRNPFKLPSPNSDCVITFNASVFNSCDAGDWEYKIGSQSWRRPSVVLDGFDRTGPTAPTQKSFRVEGLGYVPNIKGSTTLTIRIKLGTKYYTGSPVPIQIALAAKPEESSELSAASNSASLKSENIKPSSSFLIYPNPSGNQVNISINSNDEQDYILFIKDLYGRTILSKADKLFMGKNSIALDVADLVPGTYILSMVDKSGLLLESQKLQIVR